MANDVAAFVPELWSARHQRLKKASLVGLAISSFEEEKTLKFGTRTHRPTSPDFVVDNYTKYVDAESQSVTTGDEYLDIDQQKVVSWDLEMIDIKQSKYDLEMTTFDRASFQIRNAMDASRLREVLNASYDADAEQTGGSAGTPATITAANVAQFISNAKAILRAGRVEDDKEWYVVATPELVAAMEQAMITNGFVEADKALVNGYKGKFAGLRVYESTNVLHSQTYTLSTVVNTNTITIAGVTFNFATVATNAGDVDLGASDTDAAANFVLAFNGTGTPWATTYIELSAANRKIIKGLNAVASSAAGVITIYFAGKVVTSKSGAPITLGTMIANCEMGRIGAVDMVIQIDNEFQKNKVQRQTGYTYLLVDVWGKKTFTEGAQRMLNAKIVA